MPKKLMEVERFKNPEMACALINQISTSGNSQGMEFEVVNEEKRIMDYSHIVLITPHTDFNVNCFEDKGISCYSILFLKMILNLLDGTELFFTPKGCAPLKIACKLYDIYIAPCGDMEG